MTVRFHSHALERMLERGATEFEVKSTVERGEQFPAKFGRIGFRRNFVFDGKWRGRYYQTKQVEAYTVLDGSDYLVITIIVRFF